MACYQDIEEIIGLTRKILTLISQQESIPDLNLSTDLPPSPSLSHAPPPSDSPPISPARWWPSPPHRQVETSLFSGGLLLEATGGSSFSEEQGKYADELPLSNISQQSRGWLATNENIDQRQLEKCEVILTESPKFAHPTLRTTTILSPEEIDHHQQEKDKEQEKEQEFYPDQLLVGTTHQSGDLTALPDSTDAAENLNGKNSTDENLGCGFRRGTNVENQQHTFGYDASVKILPAEQTAKENAKQRGRDTTEKDSRTEHKNRSSGIGSRRRSRSIAKLVQFLAFRGRKGLLYKEEVKPSENTAAESEQSDTAGQPNGEDEVAQEMIQGIMTAGEEKAELWGRRDDKKEHSSSAKNSSQDDKTKRDVIMKALAPLLSGSHGSRRIATSVKSPNDEVKPSYGIRNKTKFNQYK